MSCTNNKSPRFPGGGRPGKRIPRKPNACSPASCSLSTPSQAASEPRASYGRNLPTFCHPKNWRDPGHRMVGWSRGLSLADPAEKGLSLRLVQWRAGCAWQARPGHRGTQFRFCGSQELATDRRIRAPTPMGGWPLHRHLLLRLPPPTGRRGSNAGPLEGRIAASGSRKWRELPAPFRSRGSRRLPLRASSQIMWQCPAGALR